MTTSTNTNILEFLRSGWFLIVFIGGVVWWAATQDYSVAEVKRNETRITSLETRTSTLESGIAQLQLKIDGIKEDLTLIKGAVIK